MPIQVSEHTLTADSAAYFAQVLRDAPTEQDRLTAALEQSGHRAFQAVFNGRPVGLLLIRESGEQPEPVTLVVHPATRGRGVGTEFARQVHRLTGPLSLPQACRGFAERAGL